MRKTATVVTATSTKELRAMMKKLTERNLEFRHSDFLIMAKDEKKVFTMVSSDHETAGKIGEILNYTPDYQI